MGAGAGVLTVCDPTRGWDGGAGRAPGTGPELERGPQPSGRGRAGRVCLAV